jgi:hypothetical protein
MLDTDPTATVDEFEQIARRREIAAEVGRR